MFLSDLIINYGDDCPVSLVRDAEFDNFAHMGDLRDNCLVFAKSRDNLENGDWNRISAVITVIEAAEVVPENIGVCITEDPRNVFFELLSESQKGLAQSFDNTIGTGCHIADSAYICDHNVCIGDNVEIGENAVIYGNVSIGSGSRIGGGCVIGAQGFNIYRIGGIPKLAYHAGKIEIGVNCIIGANSIIGQALYSYGRTRIEDYCCIGQKVTIGHDCLIGYNSNIYTGCNIAGYVKVGRNVTMAIGVSVANRILIGDNSMINIGSVIVKNVDSDSKYMSNNIARKIL